ncbi:scavenger receptor class F member 2-like isoform X2 [Saccostrea cucullata]|uniref:scavenger receptor class F member 2-like isoform X2 n=1 Tax=Saccostrea cuccullata TaxID=36930 RepID=UPI002ED09A4B
MRLQVFFFAYTFSMSMLSCQNLIGSNICRYGTIMICCKDFKQVGNTCIECDPGYRGTNCSATCPANYFGQRCGQKCDCLPFQYCNAKSGCQCNETSASCPDSNETKKTTGEGTVGTNYQYNIAPPSNTCAVHEGFPSALSFLPLIFIAITDCLRNK